MKSVRQLYDMTPLELEAEAKVADERGDTRWAAACREEIEILGRIAESFSATESRNG